MTPRDTTSPTIGSLAITSDPGSGQTYAAADEIEVTVTFSETVEVEGTPQLRLRVGTRTRTAGYDSGTGTAALVFGYEVADGDEDTDGVSIEAGRIVLNGGKIEDEADNTAVLDHEAVDPQAGHQVDGVRPSFPERGGRRSLSDADLRGNARPRIEASAGGPSRSRWTGGGQSISGVSVSDTVVTLTLNPAVEHGDTGIRVSYTPDINPIRDAVGNEAEALSNQSVSNTTGAPKHGPGDHKSEFVRCSGEPGDDQAAGGQGHRPGRRGDGLVDCGRGRSGAVHDHLRYGGSALPDSAGLRVARRPRRAAILRAGRGDNEYVVSVRVRSGTGARELETVQTFTLRVTDQREPPGIPEMPSFSAAAADSLTVHWSEPENTGPPITGYGVRYREGSRGGFTDAAARGARALFWRWMTWSRARSMKARCGPPTTRGQVTGSEPGEGMTVAPLTVGMTTGIEPPVEGSFHGAVHFFSEPVTGFSLNEIETDQDPACMDDQNTPVFCDPVIGPLETIDDRIFTASVMPGTGRVAHNYTLTITVPANTVISVADGKPNEAATLQVRIAPPGVTVPISSLRPAGNSGNGRVTLRWNTPTNTGGAPIVRYEYRWMESGGRVQRLGCALMRGRGLRTVSNLTKR